MLKPNKTLKFKFILYMGSGATIFIAVVFFWMFRQSSRNIIMQVDQQAKALLQQVLITRAWIADHGGLYLKKDPGVETNPFMPGSDVQDVEGNTYLFRNPAMVTREISQYAYRSGLYKFRLTSLNLRNPANAPLPFEYEALQKFEKNGYEASKDGLASKGWEEGVRVYRRIVPLTTEKSCLTCHADQGYTEGDIRGSLSVIIPMTDALAAINRNKYTFIVAWFGIVTLILTLLYFLLRSMVLRPVDHLHQVVEKLNQGKQAKASLDTGDEFEKFADTFNDMTRRLKKGYEGAIKSLINAVDAKDPYTKGHTGRVARHSVAIAKELGLTDEVVAEVEIGAYLHDIGKIGIMDAILQKASSLGHEEEKLMAEHVEKGARIVRDADFLLSALPAILHHHERLDGKGYPDGLQKDEIPVMARIVSVADTFDAMTTDRPYRMALSVEEAVCEIEKNVGSQFDAEVVAAFKKTLDIDAK